MFLQNTIEREKLIANITYEFNFIYTGDKKIVGATASCGCTKPVINDNTVNVKFIPVPKAEFIKAEYYITNKFIDVLFDDNTVETLTIKGNVYNE